MGKGGGVGGLEGVKGGGGGGVLAKVMLAVYKPVFAVLLLQKPFIIFLSEHDAPLVFIRSI